MIRIVVLAVAPSKSSVYPKNRKKKTSIQILVGPTPFFLFFLFLSKAQPLWSQLYVFEWPIFLWRICTGVNCGIPVQLVRWGGGWKHAQCIFPFPKAPSFFWTCQFASSISEERKRRGLNANLTNFVPFSLYKNPFILSFSNPFYPIPSHPVFLRPILPHTSLSLSISLDLLFAWKKKKREWGSKDHKGKLKKMAHLRTTLPLPSHSPWF